jgi:hypothetical protein
LIGGPTLRSSRQTDSGTQESKEQKGGDLLHAASTRQNCRITTQRTPPS